jgi:hypothetical protein
MTALAVALAPQTTEKTLTPVQREVLSALAWCFKADSFRHVPDNKGFSRSRTLHSSNRGYYSYCFTVRCPTRTLKVLVRDGWLEEIHGVPGHSLMYDYRLTAKALAAITPDSNCTAALKWREVMARRGYKI